MALLCKINVYIITMIIKITVTVIVITVMIVKPHNFVGEKKLWNKVFKIYRTYYMCLKMAD